MKAILLLAAVLSLIILLTACSKGICNDDACWNDLAIEKGNFNHCSNIDIVSEKDKCYLAVVKSTMDLTACSYIHDSETKKTCFNEESVMDILQKSVDIIAENCEKIFYLGKASKITVNMRSFGGTELKLMDTKICAVLDDKKACNFCTVPYTFNDYYVNGTGMKKINCVLNNVGSVNISCHE